MTTFVIRSSIDRRRQLQRRVLTRILSTLAIWHERILQRRQLAQLSDYQLHDIGLSRSQVFHEIEKPFWRV